MNSAIFNIHDVVTLIVLVEILFLCLVVKKFSNRNGKSTNALILLFITVAGVKVGSLLVWNDYFQMVFNYPLAPALLALCLLLEGPALLAFLRATAGIGSNNRLLLLIHLLPSLVAVILIFYFDISSQDWLPHNWHLLGYDEYLALQIVWVLYKCVPIFYIGICGYEEFAIRRKMKDQLSSISASDIRLVDIVLAGFFLHWLWSFFGYVFSNQLSVSQNQTVGIINDYFVIILVNVLFALGLTTNRELLMSHADPESAKPDQESAQIDLSKLSLIERAIAEKKPYLDGRLNLERFSEICGLRPRDVSFLINSQYNKNFYEFINELRVEEAKRLLLSEKHKTVLELALASGFNSHSAFQRFFKRFVGVSPSEFRKLQS